MSTADGALSKSPERWLEMEAELAERFPNHPEAIRRVAACIRRKVALCADCLWPLGRFLLLGSVEKGLELAKPLSQFLYGDEGHVLYLDMAEFSEKHTIGSLVGHCGGLICAYVDGKLTDPLWRYPQTVLVLGAAEKAHPDVWDYLCPMLADGRLIDGLGRVVSVKQAVIIMTTAIPIAECEPDQTPAAIERQFRPEILRALDAFLRNQ